jgi:hypothetical protein
MRLASLNWASDVSLLLEAARATSSRISTWTVSELNDQSIEECISSLNNAEAILLHPTASDPLFSQVYDRIDKKKPIVSFGLDPSLWTFSTVPS